MIWFIHKSHQHPVNILNTPLMALAWRKSSKKLPWDCWNSKAPQNNLMDNLPKKLKKQMKVSKSWELSMIRLALLYRFAKTASKPISEQMDMKNTLQKIPRSKSFSNSLKSSICRSLKRWRRTRSVLRVEDQPKAKLLLKLAVAIQRMIQIRNLD
jgi:hypothetical protein